MAGVKGATEDGLEATRARRKPWHDESISFREQTRMPFTFHDQLCDRTHGVYIPSYVTKVCFPLVDGTCQGLPFHFRTCSNMPLSSTISRLIQTYVQNRSNGPFHLHHTSEAIKDIMGDLPTLYTRLQKGVGGSSSACYFIGVTVCFSLHHALNFTHIRPIFRHASTSSSAAEYHRYL